MYLRISIRTTNFSLSLSSLKHWRGDNRMHVYNFLTYPLLTLAATIWHRKVSFLSAVEYLVAFLLLFLVFFIPHLNYQKNLHYFL